MMDHKLRMRMLRQVALRADRFYDEAEALGKKAADGLTDERRSQITGLESIANTALKTSDVFDFIKTRTARHEQWRHDDWGPELLRFVTRDLKKEREQLCKGVEGLETDSAEGIEVHLMLIREFVGQLAAQYEFTCAMGEEGGGQWR